jgi:hypothetical protein
MAKPSTPPATPANSARLVLVPDITLVNSSTRLNFMPLLS